MFNVLSEAPPEGLEVLDVLPEAPPERLEVFSHVTVPRSMQGSLVATSSVHKKHGPDGGSD